MGKGRIVDDEHYATVKDLGMKPATRVSTADVEISALRAKVAELEKEIEHLKKEHKLELENLQLHLEAKVKEAQSQMEKDFPLIATMMKRFDVLLATAMEEAKAEARRE